MKSIFPETDTYGRQHTQIYDFIWPTAAALWNLRWQVQGYRDAVTKATNDELLGRFVTGSGIHGANLLRACVDQTWEDQQAQFASYVLIGVIALYEGWAESVGSRFPQPRANATQLQFPSTGTFGNAQPGIGEALTRMSSQQSPEMRQIFSRSLTTSARYMPATIDNLLACYRYFKEMRNSNVHRNGIADQKAADAYTEFASIAHSALGLKAPLESHPVVVGKPVVLTLKGVVGFSGVVLSIVVTVDAMLSSTVAARHAFLARWKTGRPSTQLTYLPKHRRDLRLERIAALLGLPRPSDADLLATLLINEGLAS